MNTATLLDLLRDHYIKPGDTRPGCVLLTEVTAPNRTNRADAIHVGMWASRGYTVDVHELKTSHADFKRELDDPRKAEAWWHHSSTFWIVAPHEAIAPPEMLPKGWGLMVPGTRGRRFKTLVEPEHRDLQPSTALLAALLVSMETDLNNALDAQQLRLREHYGAEIDTVRREASLRNDPKTRERLELLGKLEELIGFTLDDWDWGERTTPENLAAAIRESLLRQRSDRHIGEALDRLDEQAEHFRQMVGAARKVLADSMATADSTAAASL